MDINSPEGIKRVVNSFAAGFGIGGPIGGLSNLRDNKQPVNLLNNTQDPSPNAGTGTSLAPVNPTPPTSPAAPAQGGTFTREFPGLPSPPPPMLGGPAKPPISPVGGPVMMVTPNGVAYPDQMLRQTGNVPPGAPGTQGVLDIFGGNISAQELAARMQPNIAPTALPYTPQQVSDPRQGALQFAPPAPQAPFNNQMAGQLQQIQDQQARSAAFQQAEAAAAAQRQAEMDKLGQAAQNQRQLDLAFPQENTPQTSSLPMTAPRERTPQQLSLFKRGELPRPSRAEGLRRGVGTQLPIPEAPSMQITPADLRRAGQMALFTQKGEPTVAALKSVAKPQKVVPTAQTGATQAAPTGATTTPATAAAARTAQNLKRGSGTVKYDDGSTYTGQLKAGEPHGTGTMVYADGSKYVGKWKDGVTNGQGRFEDADGTVMDGKFVNGEFQGEIQNATTQGNVEQNGGQERQNASGRLQKVGGNRNVTPQKQEGGDKTGGSNKLKQGRAKQSEKAVVETGKKKEPVKAATLKKGKTEVKAETKVEPEPATAEEQWEDKKPENAPTFDKLSKQNQSVWTNLVARNKATMADADLLTESYNDEQKEKGLLSGTITPLNVVNDEINNIEEANTLKGKAEAMQTVVQYAFFSPEDTNTAEAVARARDYLNNKRWDAKERSLIDQIVINEVNTQQSIEAVYTRGENKGVDKPWFQYAQDRQLLPQINTRLTGITVNDAQLYLDGNQLRLDNFPKETQKKLTKNGQQTSEDSSATDKTKRNAATKLFDEIQRLNSNRMAYTAKQQQDAIAKLTNLYAEVQAADLEDFETAGGNPISAYFDGGKPKTRVVNGKLRVYIRDVSDAELRGFEAEDRGEVDPDVKISEEGEAKGEYRAPFSLDDWNGLGNRDDTGRFERDDGTPINNPVPVGKIKMLVANFLAKLAIKPRTFIYKNQADLKARNPELYARAAAARTQGDFDNVSAVAYSFNGDTVIVFSDRVATEQQLNFVLAHEAIGHNGLRALIGEKQFNSLMEEIYKRSPSMQGDVDAAMAVRGMSRAEATEEYLADFAATIESSVLSRVWNAIKGVLNKMGIKFGDEAARYFVNQARRYARSGTTAQFFDAKEVAKRFSAYSMGQDYDGSGRFAQAGNLRSDNLAAGLMMDRMGGWTMDFDKAVRQFTDKAGNFSYNTDKFISKFFSLTNFRARENAGLAAVNEVLNEGLSLSMNIKVSMKEKLGIILNRAVKFGVGKYSAGEVGGITTAELDQLNSILYNGLRYKVTTLGDKRKLGNVRLFTVNDEGQLVPNQAEIDRLYQMGLVTFDEAKNGYSFEIDVAKDGKMVKETINVPGISDLDENGKVWQGYLRAREAMRDVEIQLLKARYLAYIQDKDLAFREIADITKPNADGKHALTAAERKAFEKIYRRYKEFYTAAQTFNENGDPILNPDSVTKANDFIQAVNAAIIGKSTDRNATVANFFDDKNMADDTIAFIEEFKQRLVIPEGDAQAKFTIQNRLKDIIISEISNGDADIYTKNTLATGYTPILRQGAHQVRVNAVDSKGRIVRLKQDYKEQLVYSQFENKDEAIAFAREINEGLFQGKSYRVEAYNEADGKYVEQDVYLQAVPGAALDAIAAPPELNLNEFVRGLRQFGITLNPQKMETVITALTTQNARARQRLQRAFTPGASSDGVQAIMQHIEARASTISKVTMRPRLAEIMNRNLRSSNDLWNGDKGTLDKYKKMWQDMEKNPTATFEERNYAKRRYERYAYMYNKTNEAGGYQKSNMYYNEASQLLAFIDGNKHVDEADFGSGEVVSSVRAYTSVFQLGFSVATGALNYIGALTNGIPYLATYNSKTAFGGGFGFGKSMAEFTIALNQVGLRKAAVKSLKNIGTSETGFDTAEFYDKIAASPKLQDEYGLKEHEAKFLAREIREGVMIPAQSNALTATARGRATSGAKQKALDSMMWTFNSTEQAVRRGLGLASYRLAYDRAIAAGMSEAQAAAEARDFAVETLRYSLGEYSVLNRPSAWRSGIQSFIYMYKIFPTTTIQLLSRLSPEGKTVMLLSMWMMTGLMGLPFAEDIEDIIDTIGQKILGWKKGSVRYELAKKLEEIAPGSAPFIMRGTANYLSVADLASRTSTGNMIPGTGLLLAGADVGREISEVAGPSWSMLTGVATTIPNAVKAAFTDKVSLADVLRESPVTMGRALGDMLAYDEAGAIIDRRGYVISKDLHAGTMMTRALGFYPTAASQQYEFIKVAKRATDYQREVSSGFQHAWIKARMANDTARTQAIQEAVRDWNRDTYGTSLYINNFQENAAKAYEEARRPADKRFLRTAPKASRTDLKTASEILAY
jgi:hypothetical protein